MLNAENAYLFRHALLRDAAYQLQPGSERRALHKLSFDLLCEVLKVDVGQPVAPDLERAVGPAWSELALHAELAAESPGDPLNESARKCSHFAAREDSRSYRNQAAAEGFLRFARHSGTPPDEQAAAWLKIGDLERTMGQLPAAEEAYLRMRQVAERANLRHLVAHATVLRGHTLEQMGRLDEASAVMRQSISEARAAGHPRILAKVLQLLGSFDARRGDREGAVSMLRESIEIATQQGATELRAESTRELGIELIHGSRVQEGEVLLRDAADTFHSRNERRQAVGCEVGLAIAAAVTGRHQAAVDMFRAAHDEYLRFGAVRMAAGMLRYMATSLVSLEDLSSARGALLQSRAMLSELGDEPGVRNADFSLGTVAIVEHDFVEAENLFRPLVDQATRSGDAHMAAISRSHLAEALNNLGRPDEALPMVLEAVKALAAAKNLRQWAYAQYTLSATLRLLGREAEAGSAGAEAIRLAHESGDPMLTQQIIDGVQQR